MLQMRARSMALKDAFPDTLSGIAINEYDYDGGLNGHVPKLMDGANGPDIASELNTEFLIDRETKPPAELDSQH